MSLKLGKLSHTINIRETLKRKLYIGNDAFNTLKV